LLWTFPLCFAKLRAFEVGHLPIGRQSTPAKSSGVQNASWVGSKTIENTVRGYSAKWPTSSITNEILSLFTQNIYAMLACCVDHAVGVGNFFIRLHLG
jgi:hypothetical protein